MIVWDPEKAHANLKKHGVRFSDAEAVLLDPKAITVEDESAEGERRFVSIGADAVGRLLVVVYCYRGEDILLISARRANRHEREEYEETL